jgi:hypothetical protein
MSKSPFEEWMRDTPGTVDVQVDPSIPEDGVGATKPLTGSVTQDALGYTGPDFRPRVVDDRPRGKSSTVITGEVLLDPSGEDYVPGAESKGRRSIRQRLVEKITQQVLEEHADANARYDKAVEFANKYQDKEFDALPVKKQESLKRALQMIDRGRPMTHEMARSIAMKKAGSEIIRVVQ